MALFLLFVLCCSLPAFSEPVSVIPFAVLGMLMRMAFWLLFGFDDAVVCSGGALSIFTPVALMFGKNRCQSFRAAHSALSLGFCVCVGALFLVFLLQKDFLLRLDISFRGTFLASLRP